MTDERPADADVVSHEEQQIMGQQYGKYLTEKLFWVSDGTRCPTCQRTGIVMQHTDTNNCKCGLRMQLFGNALYCWRD